MKKLTLSLLVFSFSLLTCQAQYNWQTLTNSPASWRNDDVYFINPNVGWAIHGSYYYGSYTTLPKHQFGQIWETQDAGNTWHLRHDSATAFYRCVGFIDSLNGWIGNIADSSITPDKNPLYVTHDGGKTLTAVSLPNPQPKGICGITIVNDSVVYAYGRYLTPARLAKTTNKGVSWTTQDLTSYATGLVDGKFWDKDTGFITGCNGNNGVILHTNDGGITWQTVYQGARNDTEIVWKIFFPSRDTGYATIEYVGFKYAKLKPYNTYYIKTVDGGKTWIEHPFFSAYDEEGIGFINDTIGWIGGDYKQGTYITYDGGNTWQIDNNFGAVISPFNSGSMMNRFRRFGDTLMYASGTTEYKLSGKPTGINQLNQHKAEVENYPNPYSGQTTIEYTLSQTCHHLEVRVYTTMGHLVYKNVFGEQAAGRHQFVFSTSVPLGSYYYTILSDEYTATNTMVHIK